MVTLRDTFEDRLDEFRLEYAFNEQDEAISALAVTGDLLALMFPGDEAALAMTALRAIISNGVGRKWDWSRLEKQPLDTEWRTTWREIDGWDASSTPPFLDELHDLNAFANYGILPLWSFLGRADIDGDAGQNIRERLEAAKDLPSYIEAVCLKIDDFERLSPRRRDGGTSLHTLISTRNQARGRLKFDQGQSIALSDLALLSGVTVKRIQNAIYAKTDEAPVVDKSGLVSPEACEQWLRARDFHWSIWKQVAALTDLGPEWGKSTEFTADEPNRLLEDFVFVPVASDGSMFAPSLWRDGKDHVGGFTIGAKGSEEVIPEFEAALARLTKMETPRWRRPNAESGNWGIVSGQTWKRLRKSDLEGAAS